MLLEQFITIHNAAVEAKKQFHLGNITVKDDNDYISYSNSEYSVTLDAIREKLINTHGGYLQVRYSGGIKYLDYLGGRLGLYHPGHGFRYHPETAAAGLWTTPFDLVQMGIAVSESCSKDGFLKKETAERMITPVHGSYGLCMFRYRENLSGHGGFNHGYQTYWVFIPGTSICVAVCENRNFGCLNEVGDSLILPFLE